MSYDNSRLFDAPDPGRQRDEDDVDVILAGRTVLGRNWIDPQELRAFVDNRYLGYLDRQFMLPVPSWALEPVYYARITDMS